MKRKFPPFLSYFLILSASILAAWLVLLASLWPEVQLDSNSLVTVPVHEAKMVVTSSTTINSEASDFSATTTAPSVGLANPASINCATQGGDLQIMTTAGGGQYGLCYFEDNRACEEWALMRGECPVGGRRTTGYDTEAQRYCAWLGGEVFATDDAICTLPDGRSCLASDLYLGADCGTATNQ